MRTCEDCGIELPVQTWSGPRIKRCAPCQLRRHRGHQREWRERNPEQTRASAQLFRNRLRAIIRDAKRGGCIVCGESDLRVLDLHHVRGEKLFTIGSSVGSRVGRAKLRAEIAKCDVLCANCHRRKHRVAA